MKRVPLLLPQEMVEWIDQKTKGVENRTTFIRRLIATAMGDEAKTPKASAGLKASKNAPSN